MTDTTNYGFKLNQNPKTLKFLSEEVWINKELVLEAVKKDGMLLRYASKALQNDKEVAIQALMEDGYTIKFVSQELKNDPDILRATLFRDDGKIFSDFLGDFPIRLQVFVLKQAYDNQEISHKNIIELYNSGQINEYNFERITGSKQDSKDSQKLGTTEDSKKNSSDIDEKTLFKKKIKAGTLKIEDLPNELKESSEFIMELIKEKISTFSDIPDDLKSDQDFMDQLVKENLVFLSESTNKNIAISLFENYPRGFLHLREKYKGDKEAVLATVTNDGSLLDCASPDFWREKDIMYAAVKSYPESLALGSDEILNNKDIVMLAVKQDGRLLQYASYELTNDSDVVLAAIGSSRDALKYASKYLQDSLHIVYAASTKPDGSVELSPYASDKIKKYWDKIEAKTLVPKDFFEYTKYGYSMYGESDHKLFVEYLSILYKNNDISLEKIAEFYDNREISFKDLEEIGVDPDEVPEIYSLIGVDMFNES